MITKRCHAARVTLWDKKGEALKASPFAFVKLSDLYLGTLCHTGVVIGIHCHIIGGVAV